MSSEATRLISQRAPAKGVYAPSEPSDLRSPCPVLNALANHGFLPRDGRNVHSSDFVGAMKVVGLSSGLGAVMSYSIFLEHKPFGKEAAALANSPSFTAKLLYFLRRPIATLSACLGCRMPGQKDLAGNAYINLDQLSWHNVIEHDISLTRHDESQGDNHSCQPDMLENLLASSSDGGKTLSIEDLAKYRRNRIATQKEIHPDADYGSLQHQLACGEISFLVEVFGKNRKVPCDYVRALFHEERLPVREGWKKGWWSLGFWRLNSTVSLVKKLVGLKI